MNMYQAIRKLKELVNLETGSVVLIKRTSNPNIVINEGLNTLIYVNSTPKTYSLTKADSVAEDWFLEVLKLKNDFVTQKIEIK